MQTVTDPADRAALEALLAFWRDAGVDQMYADEPQDRRAPVKPRLEPAPALPVAAPAVARAPNLGDAIAEAKALAAGAQTLEALEAAISAFDGCPLKFEGAKRAVFARGDPGAAIMAIGEGPGADEDAQGAPFVGRAGKLLDAMLKASNLSDHVFITNTVYWRAPGDRTPTPEEQAVCAPFVERAIALTKPRYLLLLGAASARCLLKRPEGILTLRGKWLDWTAEDGALTVPALPTLHPLFLLRQPAAKKKAWADLLSLADRLDRDGGAALQTER